MAGMPHFFWSCPDPVEDPEGYERVTGEPWFNWSDDGIWP